MFTLNQLNFIDFNVYSFSLHSIFLSLFTAAVVTKKVVATAMKHPRILSLLIGK